MTFWIIDWVRAFALTVLLELGVLMPWLRGVEPSKVRRLSIVVLANLATHPLVWFLFPGLLVSYSTRIALSESWAVLGEAWAYATIWPLLRWRAVLLSFVANAVSFGLGWLLLRP